MATKIKIKTNIYSKLQRELFDYFKQHVGNFLGKGL